MMFGCFANLRVNYSKLGGIMQLFYCWAVLFVNRIKDRHEKICEDMHAPPHTYLMPCLGDKIAHMLEAGLRQPSVAAGPQRRSPGPEDSAIRSKVAQAGGD
jgi:hypothetical protein